MMIKYCNKCSGKPYTEDFSVSNCPVCNSELLFEMVGTESLSNRPKLSPVNFDRASHEKTFFQSEASSSGSSFNISSGNGLFPTKSTPLNQRTNNANLTSTTTSTITPSTLVGGNKGQGNTNSGARIDGKAITGKVSQYSSTGKEDGHYRRFLVQKLIDAVVYGQRFEDVLHRFKVRVPGETDVFGNTEYRDIWVNAHGTLSGGVQIADNSEVEVYGKYKNGVFMARKINVIDNGYTTPVNFQHSVKAILYGILAIFAAIFLIYIGASSDGGFFENIGSFLKTWLITAVIIIVLYFVAIFSKIGIMARMATGKPRKFPLIGILLVSLVIALIVFNSAGIGASVGNVLTGLLSSAISIIVLLGALFIVFKLILGLF